MKGRTKHKTIFVFLLSIFVIVSVTGGLYLRKIHFYEPVNIQFKGLNKQEKKQIEHVSITPLNRKVLLEKGSVTWNTKDCYSKAIGFTMHDSIAEKVESLSIMLNDTAYTLSLKDLHACQVNNNSKTYMLPAYIKSEFTFQKACNIIKNAFLLQLLAIIFIFSALTTGTYWLIVQSKNKHHLRILASHVAASKTWKLVKHIALKIWPVLKVIIISIFIASFIFYGFIWIKYSFSSWVTGILFLIVVFALLWGIALLIIRLANINKNTRKNIKRGLCIVFLIVVSIEFILRVNGINATSNEQNGLRYLSGFYQMYINKIYDQKSPPRLFFKKAHMGKNKDFTYITHEFNYSYNFDNKLFGGMLHESKNKQDEYRIICLGHSFTMGIGAPKDSIYPVLLQHKFNHLKTNENISVFNAGVGGSDVFYEYQLLKDRLLQFNPDMVLLSLGSSDYIFYNFRGGFERFTHDGIKYRKPPSWEKFYAVSYIFRFIVNDLMDYHGVFSEREYMLLQKAASKDMYDCINQFKMLAEKHHFKLILVFIDDRGTKCFSLMHKIKEETKIPVIDLFEYSNDVLELSKEERDKLYWEIDGHCKSSGYQMFADGIYYNLEKMGIIDSLTTRKKVNLSHEQIGNDAQ